MAWIWGSTSSKEPDRPPSPAPSQAPSPAVDNSAAEIRTPAPEVDEEEYMLEVQPRGLKRKAGHEVGDISVRGFKVVYNSSKVIPAISKMHNDSVSTQPAGEHLLHLPESVQRLIYSFVLVDEAPYDVLPQGHLVPQPLVSWDITDSSQLVKRQHTKSDGTPIREAPGLLTACKQIRELAVPIFFFGNSFNIRVSNFDGLAIQPFWKLMDSHRQQAEKDPILLAGSHDELGFFEALQEKSTPLLDGLEDHISSRPTATKECEFTICRLNDPPTTSLTMGEIKCDLSYEPHWDNLLLWLRECIKGELPPFNPGDLSEHQDGHKLTSIEWLFQITKIYKPTEMDEFLKAIATHRGHLIRDDPRWAPSPQYEDIEESQTLRHATPQISPRETPSKQFVFTSSPPLPQVSTTSRLGMGKGYQHARESLGPAFRKSTSLASSSSGQRVEVKGSDDEEDSDEEELFCHTNKKRKINLVVDLDGESGDEDTNANDDGEVGKNGFDED
ncbi:hypothetical protein CB0940_10953 [Cercospora beticola]|uniref:Uncharacterized protein n=1 Tax=Cercospora beticola TaxID=122368 RepID=A0A2G5HCT3_CERBT|nr:hypothetical protein CB0940_10953 [Cercospora beticola]PIA90374.1 hypothetical protein CB0940_10953 [Cercospora beticola]WPB07700.1 hypothetical protein RHO25_012361 [Cercospora beticola]